MSHATFNGMGLPAPTGTGYIPKIQVPHPGIQYAPEPSPLPALTSPAMSNFLTDHVDENARDTFPFTHVPAKGYTYEKTLIPGQIICVLRNTRIRDNYDLPQVYVSTTCLAASLKAAFDTSLRPQLDKEIGLVPANIIGRVPFSPDDFKTEFGDLLCMQPANLTTDLVERVVAASESPRDRFAVSMPSTTVGDQAPMYVRQHGEAPSSDIDRIRHKTMQTKIWKIQGDMTVPLNTLTDILRTLTLLITPIGVLMTEPEQTKASRVFTVNEGGPLACRNYFSGLGPIRPHTRLFLVLYFQPRVQDPLFYQTHTPMSKVLWRVLAASPKKGDLMTDSLIKNTSFAGGAYQLAFFAHADYCTPTMYPDFDHVFKPNDAPAAYYPLGFFQGGGLTGEMSRKPSSTLPFASYKDPDVPNTDIPIGMLNRADLFAEPSSFVNIIFSPKIGKQTGWVFV